jgi:porin
VASPYLLGDWGGVRASLANKGVTFDFASMNDLLIDTHRDLANWSRIRGTIDIDFEKADLVRGLSFHITALWPSGRNQGGYIGSIANPSSLVSTATIRFDSWWLALHRDKRKSHP